MKEKLRLVSLLLTVVMLMSAFVTPVAAGQGNGRGQERKSEQQIQYLDAEVRVIDGQPMLMIEAEEGYVSYEFPWPEIALVDGKAVALKKQGNYFLLPTTDGYEKISIEEFEVALVAGQLMLSTSINPWWTIPIAVATASLKAAGVAITTATLKAATILIAAGKAVTARTVHVVVSSWPKIRAALIAVGKNVGWGVVVGASYVWAQGNCISCGRRTPDGHFGDIFCSGCARWVGQFFGLRP